MTRLSAGKSVFRNILKRREVTHCHAPIGALVLPEAGRHPEEAQGEDEQEEEERGHAVHHCQAGANTVGFIPDRRTCMYGYRCDEHRQKFTL